MYIELHDDLLTHPKIDRLAKRLKIKRCHAVGIMSSLWLWVARHAEDGNLSKYEKNEIAKGISWHGSSEVLFDALIELKFVDENEMGLSIHHWSKYGVRILKQSRDRQKRYRDKEAQNDGRLHDSGSAAFNSTRASLPKE